MVLEDGIKSLHAMVEGEFCLTTPPSLTRCSPAKSRKPQSDDGAEIR